MNRVRCHFCQRDLSGFPHNGLHFKVEGWESPRAQGGTNAIALRQRTGEVSCEACMSAARSGISPGQERLT